MTVHQAPERFGRVLVALQEAYRQPFSELAAALYADAVSELPIATIERAAADLIKTSKFLPKAAELRTAARAELTRTRDTRGPAPQPVALLPGRVAALRARQAADPGQQRSVRLWDAWQVSRRMIADGAATRREADDLFSESYRDLMPRAGENDWRYACDRCRDQGLIRIARATHLEHAPCSCGAGDHWRKTIARMQGRPCEN